jgi:hypothetical protein
VRSVDRADAATCTPNWTAGHHDHGPVPPAEPSPRALGESLAARFEDLAQTVAGALDAAAPRGPAAPYWIGLDRDAYAAQLADLRHRADVVLRQQYGGYELPDCWPRHVHASWELSTLASEWHHTYRASRPDLARALKFYDRWLPGAMRRITGIIRKCMLQCVMLRGPGDEVARPGYR